MEMNWSPRLDSHLNTPIFTHILYYHYGNPPGFCNDHICDENDDPIMDNPNF